MSSILRQTVLIAVTFILAAIHSVAGSFTNLYNFRDIDGANPSCNLLLSGNCLIGVAVSGGSGGGGTLFNLNTDGDDFTKLFNFGGATGANPYAGLILSGTSLYGTTGVGGSGGNGTMFKISTNGMGFTNLYNFSGGGDGANPYAGLVLCGDILYGTTWGGGSAGNGTLFKINSDGTGYSNFYSFTAAMNSGFAYTNRDGANPFASLVLSGNTLYGTTWVGGSSAAGTVFKVNTDGTAFTNLHSFSGSDGARPTANLVLSGNTLYGTTWEGGGGSPGKGTVFKINADGTGFTNLHNFSGGDGANPYAGLALSGKTLYGTTWGGGSAGNGTVFKANIDGSGFTNLHVFTTTIYNGSAYTNRDGANPRGKLMLSGNTLYGTTEKGGTYGLGTAFSVTLPSADLTIKVSGSSVVLTWNDAVFQLQASPSQSNIFTNVPNASSPYTNTINGSQRFFRVQAF